MDVLYILLVLAFLLLTWGLMKVCDTLGEKERGDKS